MNTLRRCFSTLIVAGLAASPVLTAQLASATVAKSEKSDEPIQLSEFTVESKTDHGYIASESVTGTRVATQIKDLPFTVSVITSEFMQDFDFFDIAKDMVYTASLNSVDTQGNSTLRGYGATFYLRNGFYRLGLVDRVNTDRIEVIKGPNAAIYGSTSPAGLINIVTKVPRFTTFERMSLTGGSLDLRRGELNVNTPLGSLGRVKLAQLFSAEAQNNGSATPFAAARNRVLDENLLAKFPDGSTLNLEVEWSKRRSVTDTSAIPFEYNAKTKTYSAIQRKDLAHFSQGGPDSVQNRELVSYYLTYDKRWNDVWSTHAGANAYFRHAFNFNNGSSDQFDPSTNLFGRGNVLVDPLNEDGGGVQVDTLARYKLLDGKLENKTLFTADYSQNWRYRQQTQVNQNLWTISPINLLNPVYDLPPRWAFNIITRRDKVRWDIRGFLLRQQTTALDGRLIGFAGLRRDEVTYNFNFGNQYNASGKSVGTVKTAGAVSHYTDTAWSPNFGFNYKATPNLALYASHSQSFSPNGQVAKLGDPHLANETSVGWDYGVKASYLQDRLVFTAGGYYIDRYGVKATVTDPVTLVKETVAAGTQLARGVEFEGSWRINDDCTVLASYSHVDAVIVYNGDKTTDVGQPPAALPVEQASLAWKYNFSRGPLKGLAWNGGFTYSGQAFPNSTATDARRNVAAPGYGLVNLGLTYTWKGAGEAKHSLRLSAKNLLDREYEDNKGNFGDARAWYLAYTLNH